MPEISFRLSRHLVRQVNVVEVWYGDTFVATITPPEPEMRDTVALTVVSKYLSGEAYEIKSYPPAVVVLFDMTKQPEP